ncbi:MAG TPA: NAD-dependent epimerase/dehydratase family protein [Bacteroidota bacterium]|nr:NAD-dependent epimerase/dehydratase family protein [Bacteroidota bacterium]
MDIRGKTVLVIGGWGLVGSAVCRRFMEEHPRRMIVTSLTRAEAREAVAELEHDYPEAGKNFFIPWSGNIFVREQLKDLPREVILSSEKHRTMVIEDIVEELTGAVLKRSSLYQLMQKYKPDVVVDCVNSATGIAYQDIFQVSRSLIREVKRARGGRGRASGALLDATERLLCTLYVPQLIRHVQIMYRSMQEAGTGIYVKIGTSGTGGMGLNIPYTHSEERPSRVLLSKSAVAGAHTLLLFLMGRTPDAPITKEIKPTAAIAWKKIAYGEITRRGKAIALVDCPPSSAVRLTKSLRLSMPTVARPTKQTLRSVYIDTGENGLFSRGEFEAISTPGQMEFVTPEEIAESAIFEIKAGNTGHDIINALDNATLAPTYRAGFMFNSAMDSLQQLEKEHGVDSIAFEMLGPPRLSKLLYESYLLKLCFGDIRSVTRSDAKTMSRRLNDLIEIDGQLRSQIISIGIPILLPDGRSMLRAASIKIPPPRGEETLPVTPKAIDQWAHDGWVDLRETNMALWLKRFGEIARMVESLPAEETSSRIMHNRDYWKNLAEIDPGKICGWIFTYEEKGKRMKA